MSFVTKNNTDRIDSENVSFLDIEKVEDRISVKSSFPLMNKKSVFLMKSGSQVGIQHVEIWMMGKHTGNGDFFFFRKNEENVMESM